MRRILVAATLLTYLELEGVTEATGPFYAECKVQPLRPLDEVIGRFDARRAEFLRGWRSAAGKLVPGEEGDGMLRALELEKLLYEIRYEVGHRPDWVRIPARDLFSETER